MKNENLYDEYFKKYGTMRNIDWLLLKAQVKQESGFNPNARSSVGALGLAQFMKPTWDEWYGVQAEDKRTDPELSIKIQAIYMQWLIRQSKGDVDQALACYNCGIGNVRRLIKKHGTFALALPHLPKETQDYIRRINLNYNKYKRALYGY